MKKISFFVIIFLVFCGCESKDPQSYPPFALGVHELDKFYDYTQIKKEDIYEKYFKNHRLTIISIYNWSGSHGEYNFAGVVVEPLKAHDESWYNLKQGDIIELTFVFTDKMPHGGYFYGKYATIEKKY